MNLLTDIRKASKQGGFTLLEVMLVLALIGLILASVRFAVFGDDKYSDIEKEVNKLQVLFNMASDYAVINQREMGLRLDLDKQTYEFVMLDENQNWQALQESKHFQQTQLSEGIELELLLDGFAWLEEDSFFDNRIFDEQLSVSSDGVEIGDEEEKERLPPQVFILSSGEITPFELIVRYQPQDFDEESFEFVLRGEDTVPLTKLEPNL